jgi:hypothetical protein
MLKSDKSLADALRERAEFLNQYPNTREHGWGDNNSVVAALYEFADVVDSWSGEYLSKELTYEENQRRRWRTTQWTQTNTPPMTMEERIEAVKRPYPGQIT